MNSKGPFYCAESSILLAEEQCMDIILGLPPAAALADLTVEDATLGLVDNPVLMKDDSLYLFSGTADTVVNTYVVKQLEAYYSYFLKSSNIVTEYNVV